MKLGSGAGGGPKCRPPGRGTTTPTWSATTTPRCPTALALAALRRARAEPDLRARRVRLDRPPWTGRQLPGACSRAAHRHVHPEGTFDAAIARLDHLVDLGVDLVELLPVNAFNGEHNWGYDGVCWYAPTSRTAGRTGSSGLVEPAQPGLGVVLDVVYNHLGPSGAYAPRIRAVPVQGSNTWGRGVNLDGPESARCAATSSTAC